MYHDLRFIRTSGKKVEERHVGTSRIGAAIAIMRKKMNRIVSIRFINTPIV